MAYKIGEAVGDSNPHPQKRSGANLVDISVLSASGSSEPIAPASISRDVLNISNPDADNSWWINETGGVASAGGAGCFELKPGARWTPRPAPRNVVTGIAQAATALSVAVG